MPFIIPADDKVLLKIGEGEHLNPPLAEFNVFVWNVFKGQRAEPFARDFQSLGQNQDFILLQEAMLDERMPKIWQESFTGYEWNIAQSFHYKKNLYGTGVAMGSKVKPTQVGFVRAHTRELFWLTPKISLFTEYQINGQKVLFVCTHVLNFVTTGAFSESLYQIAERISQFDGSVILAGDFNTWNLRRYLIMKSIFRELKLEHLDLEQDHRRLKLDHIFVRGFSVLKARVHHKISSSDHYPLEIRLKL